MAKLIVLDPGHGGNDPGAVNNGLQEKDLTLAIARKVAAKLAAYDVTVKFTRDNDSFVSLYNRADFANRLRADYFCSIHINSGGGTGFESYVHTAAGQTTKVIRSKLHKPIAAYYSQAGFRDRGMKNANFAVIRETQMPSVLLENLFIDNPTDAAQLKDAQFLDGLAAAIAEGLITGLSLTKRPETRPTAPPLPPSHWAQGAYDFLKKEGLVTGEHNLDSPVSWGEFSTVIKRLWDKLIK